MRTRHFGKVVYLINADALLMGNFKDKAGKKKRIRKCLRLTVNVHDGQHLDDYKEEDNEAAAEEIHQLQYLLAALDNGRWPR